MKCIKPSSPYITLLFAVFLASFIVMPTEQNNDNGQDTLQGELITKDAGESRLEQIENLSMLNSDSHE